MGMNVARYKAASAPVVSAARSETPTPLERRAQKFPSSSTLHAAPGGGRCPPAPSPSLVGEPHHTHYLSGCRQKAPHNISTYSTHSLGKLDAPTVPVNGVFLPVITGVFKPVIGAQSNLEVSRRNVSRSSSDVARGASRRPPSPSALLPVCS
jgi:hypothetical protein